MIELKDCKCGRKPNVKRELRFKRKYVDDDMTKIYCKNKDCNQPAIISFTGYESAVKEWNRSV